VEILDELPHKVLTTQMDNLSACGVVKETMNEQIIVDIDRHG
jgi:hypothetical protein